MTPTVVATVIWCSLCCLVFVENTDLMRDEIMNIRETTPADLFPTFLASSMSLLDILVKGALTVAHEVNHRRRRRGRRAGVLVHFLKISDSTTWDIPLHCVFTVQQTGRTSATVEEKQ